MPYTQVNKQMSEREEDVEMSTIITDRDDPPTSEDIHYLSLRIDGVERTVTSRGCCGSKRTKLMFVILTLLIVTNWIVYGMFHLGYIVNKVNEYN